MKKFILILVLVSVYGGLAAQETDKQFSTTEFQVQFQKLLCAGKNDFADLIDKQVVVAGDTTWKSKLSLPGFKHANFSKSKSMIDYAFVAYQKFSSKEEALTYYQEIKKAVDFSSGGECIKMEPAKIPMEVQGVQQYELWKSIKPVPYKTHTTARLFVSLNLDAENEVVINVFLKKGEKY